VACVKTLFAMETSLGFFNSTWWLKPPHWGGISGMASVFLYFRIQQQRTMSHPPPAAGGKVVVQLETPAWTGGAGRTKVG